MNILYIVSAADRLKYTSVSIASLLRQHPDMGFDFYIINPQTIKDADLEKLREMITCDGRKNTTIHNIHYDINVFDALPTIPARYGGNSLYASSVPHLFLPENVERAFVLGSDVLCFHNIESFYNLDFKGCKAIAMGPEYYFDRKHFSKDTRDTIITTKFSFGLFNTDTYMINLHKYRDDKIDIKDIEESYKKRKGLWLHNQTATVDITRGNILYANSLRYSFAVLMVDNQSIDYDVVDPSIVHYVHIPKPWTWHIKSLEPEDYQAAEMYYEYNELLPKKGWDIYPRKRPLKSKDTWIKITAKWWEYAQKTPYYEQLLLETQPIKDNFEKFALPVMDAYNRYRVKTHVKDSSVNAVLDIRSDFICRHEYNRNYFATKNVNNEIRFFNIDGKRHFHSKLFMPLAINLKAGRAYRLDVIIAVKTASDKIKFYIRERSNHKNFQIANETRCIGNELSEYPTYKVSSLFECNISNADTFYVDFGCIYGKDSWFSFESIKITEVE